MNKSRVARRSDYIGAAVVLGIWVGCSLAPVVDAWRSHTSTWLVLVMITQGIFGVLAWRFGSEVGSEVSRTFFSSLKGDHREDREPTSPPRRVWSTGPYNTGRGRDHLDV